MLRVHDLGFCWGLGFTDSPSSLSTFSLYSTVCDFGLGLNSLLEDLLDDRLHFFEVNLELGARILGFSAPHMLSGLLHAVDEQPQLHAGSLGCRTEGLVDIEMSLPGSRVWGLGFTIWTSKSPSKCQEVETAYPPLPRPIHRRNQS